MELVKQDCKLSRYAWPGAVFHVQQHDGQAHQIAFWEVESDGKLAAWCLSPNLLFRFDDAQPTPDGAGSMQAEIERIKQLEPDDFFDEPPIQFTYRDDDECIMQ